jgi:hypothetical protein
MLPETALSVQVAPLLNAPSTALAVKEIDPVGGVDIPGLVSVNTTVSFTTVLGPGLAGDARIEVLVERLPIVSFAAPLLAVCESLGEYVAVSVQTVGLLRVPGV